MEKMSALRLASFASLNVTFGEEAIKRLISEAVVSSHDVPKADDQSPGKVQKTSHSEGNADDQKSYSTTSSTSQSTAADVTFYRMPVTPLAPLLVMPSLKRRHHASTEQTATQPQAPWNSSTQVQKREFLLWLAYCAGLKGELQQPQP